MSTMTDETYNEASEPRSDGHMNDESFNGYANRETWAFNLHWSNDEGLYAQTLAAGEDCIDGIMLDNPDANVTDFEIGEAVVAYWRDYLDEVEGNMPEELRMFEREVGSWWRIDYTEVGAAVREALDL